MIVGRTTLVVAHRLSTVRHADAIVVVDDRSALDVGTHDDLLLRWWVARCFPTPAQWITSRSQYAVGVKTCDTERQIPGARPTPARLVVHVSVS